jgi:hypothetical protein
LEEQDLALSFDVSFLPSEARLPDRDQYLEPGLVGYGSNRVDVGFSIPENSVQ